jgi:hypothetical protein
MLIKHGEMMNKLLGFSRCPKCAERGNDRAGNNFAEYAENFYCFACGYFRSKRSIERVESFYKPNTLTVDSVTLEGVTDKLPEVAIKWLMRYQLTPDEIRQFKWCDDGLILVLTESYYQIRTFKEGMPKYLSKGRKPFITFGNNLDGFVFVEDVLSAIKCGRVITASPILGTMPDKSILRGLQGYKNIFLWLDKDATIKSLKTAKNMSEIICKPVKVVIGDKDPKAYTTAEIKDKLL